MSDEEQQLLGELRRGSNVAFRALLEGYTKKVYAITLGFVRSAEDAEDLAQEVFIEAFESVGSFRGDCAIATWLHRIAVTKSLDYLRARKRKKRFALLVSLFGDNGLVVDPADPIHPGIQFEDKEKALILFAAIERLPEQQRIAYLLNKVDDLSVQETADAMSMSYKAVESLLMRAKNNLQKMLRAYYEK